ncbi:MAG TPA: hypothetical protein VIN59_01110 [Alphaproteobacteria bacterium]
MKLDMLTSTAGFGAVVMVTTLGLFLNGAKALDLGDFSAIDQKMITQEAPKAGGIALIKEDTVVKTSRGQPMLTAVSSSARNEGTYYDYNNISPAAGGSFKGAIRPDARPVAGVQPAETLSGRTTPPVAARGIGGPNDSATDPTDPFAKVQARLQASGAAQLPEPGSAHAVAELEAGVTPLTPAEPLVHTMSTQSMASNAPVKSNNQSPVSDLVDIAPAAGDSDNNTSVQSGGTFNN